MKIIKNVSEINKPGQYQFDWLDEVITIGTELNRNDDLVYCISIGNLTIMTGWQVKTWKTIKGIQSAIDEYMIHQEYGLYPEPPRMTLDELKRQALKRGVKGI